MIATRVSAYRGAQNMQSRWTRFPEGSPAPPPWIFSRLDGGSELFVHELRRERHDSDGPDQDPVLPGAHRLLFRLRELQLVQQRGR